MQNLTQKILTTSDIRSLFLNYFKSNGHVVLPSSSIVPFSDQSLLFTNSGMVQFKNIFTGAENTDFKRVTTAQKCIRAGGKHNDLENVGYTARHHTFFEMLGNFSFGDYFKKEAIFYAWEFLTKHLMIPAEKLYITVYHEDDEAYNLWKDYIGIPSDRIIKISTKDNFWEMGESGPCGPCSEVFYDYGPDHKGGLPGSPEQDDGERYIEIWNLVFMQFGRINGNLRPLAKKSIDTGMGLERVAAVCQNVHDNYKTDIFTSLIQEIDKIHNDYNQTLIGHHRITKESDNYIMKRVVADHIRSSSFLIAECVMPGSNGREYVVRRILRRAIVYLYQSGYVDPILYKIAEKLISLMGAYYTELNLNKAIIINTIKEEEVVFLKTLNNGFKEFESIIDSYPIDSSVVKGEDAFKLYDTFGLPLDLTADIAHSRGMTVDSEGFEKCMDQQKDISKSSWKGGVAYEEQNHKFFLDLKEKYGETEFVGYDHESYKSNLIGILNNDNEASEDKLLLIFSSTPMYSESGGQESDKGFIYSDDGKECLAEIADVKKFMGIFIHECRSRDKTKLNVGNCYCIKVDSHRRSKIRANHTCAHILHSVLQEIIGGEAQQKGSSVGEERFRLDFSCQNPLSDANLKEIERRVNDVIFSGTEVSTDIMDLDSALKSGSMALFEEKYSSFVRVVKVEHDRFLSKELCCGTHVSNTRDIGIFKILLQESVAKGIRRIEGLTNKAALDYLNLKYDMLNTIANNSKLQPDLIADFIDNLIEKNNVLQGRVSTLEKSNLYNEVKNIKPRILEWNGKNLNIFVLNTQVSNIKIIRELANDYLRKRDTIMLLINKFSDTASILIGINNDLSSAEGLQANALLSKIALKIGIKPGGGNKSMANTGCEIGVISNINIDFGLLIEQEIKNL